MNNTLFKSKQKSNEEPIEVKHLVRLMEVKAQ